MVRRFPLAWLLSGVCWGACWCGPSWAASSLREIRAEEQARVADSRILGRAAYSRDPATAAAAFRAMGRIQSGAYAKTLNVGLLHRDLSVRGEAVFALGQVAISAELGDAERGKIAGSLGAMARKADPRLRPAVVEALGKAGGPAAERTLAGLLRDQDPRTRGEAALALFRLKFLKRIPEYSSATVEALAASFADPDRDARWRAVYAFSRWPEPRAKEALARAVGDEELWARFFSVRALGQLGPEAPPDVLAGALNDTEPLVRAEAARALGAARRADLLEAAVFLDPSPHVRAAAAEAVGASGNRGLSGRIEPMLSEGSPLARGAAVEAWAKLLKDAAMPALSKERTHRHWWVRSRAYLAMQGLAGGEAALREGIKDPDPRVAAAALEAVARSSAAFSDADLAAVLRDVKAPLEVLGTAVEAALDRKSAELLGPVLDALANPEAAANVELADEIAKTVRAIAGAHPEAGRGSAPPAAPSRRFPPSVSRVPEGAVVILETEKGEIEVALVGREAPAHVANFLAMTSSGVYDNAFWHRVVSGFVIQGGDPRGSGWGDAGITLRDEINPLRFERGVVGMPNAGKDTGGCQLFITHVPAPHLDGRYTAFGRVTRGIEVVDRIEPGDRIVRAYVKGR